MPNPSSFTLCNGGAARIGALAFQGAGPIAAGAVLRLCAGTNLTASSAAANVGSNEISVGGYSPFSLGVSGNGYNSTMGTQDITFAPVSFTPTAAVNFQQAALLLSDGTLFGFFEWDLSESLDANVPYQFSSLAVPIGGEGSDVSPQP